MDLICNNSIFNFISIFHLPESNACADGLHDCKPDEACITTLEGLGYVCIPKTGDNPCPPGFKPAAGNNNFCEGKKKKRLFMYLLLICLLICLFSSFSRYIFTERVIK